MHPTRIFTRRFWRLLSPILAVGSLVSAFMLMPGIVGAALKSSHPAIPLAGETLASYPAQGPNNGTNPINPNGGRVILTPQAYLIFEDDPNNPFWTQPYQTGETNMQQVQQYFSDVNGSALEGILTQYYYLDSSNTRHYISNTITVAGAVRDPNFSYSNHCQGTNLLYDPGSNSPYPNDMINEITKEISANAGWTNSNDAIFFVFTPPDYSLAYATCTGQGNPPNNLFCAYHTTLNGYNYAAMNWGNGIVNCSTDGNITDTMINEASHEQFEAISDPDASLLLGGGGWYNEDCNPQPFGLPPVCEIGDKCQASSQSGVDVHPGVYLNGHMYDGVQGEFSDATLACEYTKAPPPPTPTSTNTPVPTCSVTNETDNIQPGNGRNPYTDNRGNTWYVYYDIKRDSKTNAPCQMRVVVRIFPPATNGTWSGTAAVFAEQNRGILSASFGKVTGSCTYQYHFVWRGPWFNVSSGSYLIEDTEYNGSNAYTRAYASFSI